MKPVSLYDNVLPLLPGSTLKVRSTYPAKKRGLYSVSEVRISTIYPLGLFRAWTWLEAPASYYVYPSPQGDASMPESGIEAREGTQQQSKTGGEDFHGHRKFQTGDSHRHVDWKARARGRPMLVKEFTEGSPESAFFDWNNLSGSSEERLSQLSLWIVDARKSRIAFGLRIPGLVIPSGHGTQHAKRCLEALASFGGVDDTP